MKDTLTLKGVDRKSIEIKFDEENNETSILVYGKKCVTFKGVNGGTSIGFAKGSETYTLNELTRNYDSKERYIRPRLQPSYQINEDGRVSHSFYNDGIATINPGCSAHVDKNGILDEITMIYDEKLNVNGPSCTIRGQKDVRIKEFTDTLVSISGSAYCRLLDTNKLKISISSHPTELTVYGNREAKTTIENFHIGKDSLNFADNVSELSVSVENESTIIRSKDGKVEIKLLGIHSTKDVNAIKELVSKRNIHDRDFEPKREPAITEEITDSSKIYHVNPGYNQGDYYKEEGGLFITNLSVSRNLNEDKSITFDVYNTKDAIGIIEYYDESGNIIRADLVDPHGNVITNFDSWWEKLKNTLDINSIKEYGFFDMPITDPSVSKHVSVEAPKGTHKIVVTNNAKKSIYAQMYNFVDQIFKLKGLYDNVKDILDGYDVFKKDDVSKSLTEKVKENVALEIIHKLQTNFSDDKESLMETIGEEGINKWILNNLDLQKTFENSLEYVIEDSGKIIEEGAKSVVSKVCSTLLKGNPAIWGLDGIKFTGNVLDAASKFFTAKQLEKARPMIFQFEY